MLANNFGKINYKFILNIAGEIDFQNKSYLNKKNFNEIIENKNINFLGKSNNMLEVYKKMDIVVLLHGEKDYQNHFSKPLQ